LEALRTFIAIEPDPPARAWLALCLQALRGRFPGVRWVRPEHLHITLRFLGDVEAGRIDGLKALVGRAARGTSPFRVDFGPPGAFGSRHSPRVFWLGLRPGRDLDLLQAFQRRLEEDLVAGGFGLEDHPWTAHLTLGRNPDGRPAEGWEAVLPHWEGSGPCGFPVPGVHLFRSELAPKGPIHTVLQVSPLGDLPGAEVSP